MSTKINHKYKPSDKSPNILFDRVELHSSIDSLTFIEELLKPLGYVTNKTLDNSISSAITSIEKKEYMKCIGSQYTLTNKGFGRLKEIVVKYEKSKKEPFGKTKELIHALNCLSEEEKKKNLDNL